MQVGLIALSIRSLMECGASENHDERVDHTRDPE